MSQVEYSRAIGYRCWAWAVENEPHVELYCWIVGGVTRWTLDAGDGPTDLTRSQVRSLVAHMGEPRDEAPIALTPCQF